jgi:hypothetical protein
MVIWKIENWSWMSFPDVSLLAPKPPFFFVYSLHNMRNRGYIKQNTAVCKTGYNLKHANILNLGLVTDCCDPNRILARIFFFYFFCYTYELILPCKIWTCLNLRSTSLKGLNEILRGLWKILVKLDIQHINDSF